MQNVQIYGVPKTGKRLKPLDGFVMEVIGKQYCSTYENFKETAHKVLVELGGKEEEIAKRTDGWHVSYQGEPCFISTFAPFYSPSSSRYMFQLSSASSISSLFSIFKSSSLYSCFILIQPRCSFQLYSLSPLTTEEGTEWQNPTTIRDRIRCLYKKHGRKYFILKDLDNFVYPIVVGNK